jgi:hypothetical protein
MARGGSPGQPLAPLTLKRQIELGMQGLDVKACKRGAARAGFPKGQLAGVTDSYGAADVAFIKQFQQANALDHDGVIGDNTFEALVPFLDALATKWYRDFVETTYANPLRHATGIVLARTDQGVDYFAHAGSPIEAIGRAKITRSATDSGWPGKGVVQYLLLDGDHAGAEIYVAEWITPVVTKGQIVQAGDPIAKFRFNLDHLFRGIETGYIRVGTNEPVDTDISGEQTPGGRAFARFLRSVGCPTQQDPGQGSSMSPSHA